MVSQNENQNNDVTVVVPSDMAQTTIFDEKEENCFCEKKQCMLGVASIAIGIGGFVLASLL